VLGNFTIVLAAGQEEDAMPISDFQSPIGGNKRLGELKENKTPPGVNPTAFVGVQQRYAQ
jgi:hypothetical protein